MKLFIKTIVAFFSLSLITVPFLHGHAETSSHITQSADHAKWGRLAVKQTQMRYPVAQIKDYAYLGRGKGKNLETQRFKLWLQQGEKKFTVFITIKVDPKNNTMKKIQFVESLN